MTFRVETTAEAEREADAILEWLISEHAGDTGVRWFRALQDAIESLAKFPERCPLAPESATFPFEVRQLLYGRSPHVYRILFTMDHSFAHSPRPPSACQTLTEILALKIKSLRDARSQVSNSRNLGHPAWV